MINLENINISKNTLNFLFLQMKTTGDTWGAGPWEIQKATFSSIFQDFLQFFAFRLKLFLQK